MLMSQAFAGKIEKAHLVNLNIFGMLSRESRRGHWKKGLQKQQQLVEFEKYLSR